MINISLDSCGTGNTMDCHIDYVGFISQMFWEIAGFDK